MKIKIYMQMSMVFAHARDVIVRKIRKKNNGEL